MANNSNLEIYNKQYSDLNIEYTNLKKSISMLSSNTELISTTLDTYKTNKETDLNKYINIYDNLLKYKQSYNDIFDNILNKTSQINNIINFLNTLKEKAQTNNQFNNIIILIDNFIELSQRYNNTLIGLSTFWNNYVQDFTQKLYKILLNIYLQKFKNNTSQINLSSLPSNTTEKYKKLAYYGLVINNIRSYINNLKNVIQKIEVKNPNNIKSIDSIINGFTSQLDNIESSVNKYLKSSGKLLKESNNKSIIDIQSSLKQLLNNILKYMIDIKAMSNSNQLTNDYKGLQKLIENFGQNKLSRTNLKSVEQLGEIIGDTNSLKLRLSTSLPLIIGKINDALKVQNIKQSTTNISQLNPQLNLKTKLNIGTKVTFNPTNLKINKSNNSTVGGSTDLITGTIKKYSGNNYIIKNNSSNISYIVPSNKIYSVLEQSGQTSNIVSDRLIQPNGLQPNGLQKVFVNGYNQFGYNGEGYNRERYSKEGYSKEGYNREGFNKNGYNKNGYNKQGLNALRNPKPIVNPNNLLKSSTSGLSNEIINSQYMSSTNPQQQQQSVVTPAVQNLSPKQGVYKTNPLKGNYIYYKNQNNSNKIKIGKINKSSSNGYTMSNGKRIKKAKRVIPGRNNKGKPIFK